MTERLADISARIDGIRQLGAVVNAMKGIAAARARVARAQLDAVDSYAATIAAAMASAIGPADAVTAQATAPQPGKPGLLVFCAEQGFAGAFSERVLDSIGPDHRPGADPDPDPGPGPRPDPDPPTLFLIGTRGLSIAAARGIVPLWSAAMPSHTPGIPKLADSITKAIYNAVNAGNFDRLDVVFTRWVAGQPTVRRQKLFPIDLSHLPSPVAERPVMQLSLDRLMDRLDADYIHALVCAAALHAFAAENEARMEAMTAAGSQIGRELETFEATLRRARQEAITAEIIELGTGAVAAG